MDPAGKDSIEEHLREIGQICIHWAYLEFLLELTVWWLLGILNDHIAGRTLTASWSIDLLGNKARDLAYLRITSPDDCAILDSTASRIQNIKDDRNLAVHGVHSLMPDDTILTSIARGKYKHQPEAMPLIRLRSIVVEIACIIAELEPMLARYQVIEGTTAISERYRFPRQQ